MGNEIEKAFNPNLEIPEVESDYGLSNVRLEATATVTPKFTDTTGLQIEKENKLEMVLRNSNSDVISTLIQLTQQLISTIETIDMSLTIGDDEIAQSAKRGNDEYRNRTGKPLFA